MRLLLLDNIPTPHTVPVFEALAREVGQLTVLFCASTEGDRRWKVAAGNGYTAEVLPGRQLSLFRGWDTLSFHFNHHVGDALRRHHWDVIIGSGWQQPASWNAFFTAHRLGRPHVLWAGSTKNERTLLRTLSKPLVRRFVRGSTAWASYGSAAARYLVELGAVADRVVPAYHTIDNDDFLGRLATAKPAALRARLGLGDDRIILFVGRLVATKGIADLLAAAASALAARPDARLVVAGEGAQRVELEAQAARLGVRCSFVGHIASEDLPTFYAAASCVVLPSLHEVWGLVINEGALAGLPVIASSACGATEDLVREGETGFVVAPGDRRALSQALGRVLDDPRRATKMGLAGRELVERVASPKRVAASLARAARLALEAPR